MKDVEKIYHAFGGRLAGNERMKREVCNVISYMPEKIGTIICKKCWFFASMEDAWAFTFDGNDLKDKHMIFLSDELLAQDEKQIHYTIAHEIGHVILGHRNSIFSKQSKAEIAKQEKEADKFAQKYFPLYS